MPTIKRKQLTMRAAFLLIARAFERAKKSNGVYLAKVCGRPSSGLCYSFRILWLVNYINNYTHNRIVELMCDYQPEETPDEGYWWSTTTKAGALARAKFCRKMADLYKEKPCK